MAAIASTPTTAYAAIFTRFRFFLCGRFTSIVWRGTSKPGRFTSAGARFASLEGRGTSLEERGTSVEGRFTSIRFRFTSIQTLSFACAWKHSRSPAPSTTPVPHKIPTKFQHSEHRTPHRLSVSENRNPKIEKIESPPEA